MSLGYYFKFLYNAIAKLIDFVTFVDVSTRRCHIHVVGLFVLVARSIAIQPPL